MDSLWLGLAVALLLVLLGWWWRRRNDGAAEASAELDRLDTLIGWPPEATRVLGHRERAAFGLLVRALPDHIVLAQVPVSRFLSVPKRNSYADWLRRLGYQCVDFAVCDVNAQVVAVVELQPAPGRASEQSRRRQERMARTLKAAKIPLHVWPEQLFPTLEAVRQAIAPPPPAPAVPLSPASSVSTPPVAAGVPAPAPAPTSPLNPFDDDLRDSTQDEFIELLEPPPTTWFDDMDSNPVPLSKPKPKPAPGRR